ncbi:hypothetical protein UPYG_G00060530 [Umbra pygmaea]|uniref:B-cell receptor CD22 n=1 Tax=Umbra pygmaea TaxID=75934 RepID=A0ABD0X991_UMBPY
MSLTSTGSVLVVFLWSVTVVLGQYGWSVTYTTQSICALKGSTVNLSCSYSYPSGHTVTDVGWYYYKRSWTKVQDTDGGRVSYIGNKKDDCTLRITDLREEDKESYYFRFYTSRSSQSSQSSSSSWSSWTNGLTLYVTDLRVKVKPGINNRKKLTCSSTCTLPGKPTYIWYKNGQHIDESTSPQYKESVDRNYEDSYSCAVKDHEDLHSPVLCVNGQKCIKVIYTKRRICVLKGTSVDISCTYDGYNDVTSSLWFSPKQSGRWRNMLIPEDLTTDPGYAGRVEYPDQESRSYRGPSTLRITDVREEDSAEYRFTFKTHNVEWGQSLHGTTLTVTGVQVTMTPPTVSEGQAVTLTCRTTCSLTDNPTYTWYKNGQPHSHTYSLYVDQFRDADSYSCAVRGHEHIQSPAVCKMCWSVIYTHQNICTLKGTTVDIPCSYKYPSYHEVIKAFWFTKWESGKEPEDLSLVLGYDGRIEYRGDKKNDCTLRITNLTLTDTAQYMFRFITNGGRAAGTPVSLNITDIVLEMDHASVSEGDRVTLTCRTKCTLDPIPEYIWYKNRQPIENTLTPVYNLSVTSEDAGRYSCAVKGHEDIRSTEKTLTVRYFPKNTSVSVSPSGEIVEGSSVTLTCSSDANPPVDNYTWYKKNETSPKASGQSYSITNIRSEDSGEYYCEVKNKITSRNSTDVVITVTGKLTSVMAAAVGITVAVLIIVVLTMYLFVFKKLRKIFSKSSSDSRDTADSRQVDSSPLYDNISRVIMTSTTAQTANTDNQEDLYYTSVHFSSSKNQEVPLYCTIQQSQPQKQEEEVQYAAVKLISLSAATRLETQTAEKDSSQIYSTVNKPRTKMT